MTICEEKNYFSVDGVCVVNFVQEEIQSPGKLVRKETSEHLMTLDVTSHLPEMLQRKSLHLTKEPIKNLPPHVFI